MHALDQSAADFYERFGFRSLGTAPRTLMVTLAELRKAGYVGPTPGTDVADPR